MAKKPAPPKKPVPRPVAKPAAAAAGVPKPPAPAPQPTPAPPAPPPAPPPPAPAIIARTPPPKIRTPGIALDFPDNPQVDDVFENWKWDGARWARSGGNGGGGGGPQMGVTDGSNAAPGMVGEYAEMTLVSGGSQPQFNLTAGDWDVSGHLTWGTGATFPAADLQWSGEVGAVLINLYGPVITGVGSFITIPPQRVSSAVNFYVWVEVLGGAANTMYFSGGKLRARRMR